MKKFLIFSILLILIAGNFIGCSSKHKDNGQITIATSISVISSILNEVLPDNYKSFYIIPENANPHTFTVTPDVAIKLNESDVIVYMGAKFDDNWIKAISLPEGVKEINLSKFVNLSINNPHYWMDIPLFTEALDSLFVYFYNFSGDSSIIYRYKKFKDDMIKTHDKYKKEFLKKENLKVVSIVPAFSWMLKDMNIEEKDILIKKGGSQPTPVDIANFINTIKKENIKVVLALYGSNTNYVEMIKKQVPDVKVVNLSPLLGRIDGVKTFKDLMDYNYRELENALFR